MKNNEAKRSPDEGRGCEKYELAITNFVMGEKFAIPQEELFNHLAKCKNCQDDLRNWRATYATMCAKEYDSKPEVKQKNEAFIKGLVYGQPISGEKSRDAKQEIGSAAGKIHACLKQTGKASIPVIREKTGLINYPFYEAIGWLAREEKVTLTKDAKTAYVAEAR